MSTEESDKKLVDELVTTVNNLNTILQRAADANIKVELTQTFYGGITVFGKKLPVLNYTVSASKIIELIPTPIPYTWSR